MHVCVYVRIVCHEYIGQSYIGNNYTDPGHTYPGTNCIGHSHKGRTHVRHDYMGHQSSTRHKYIGHDRVALVHMLQARPGSPCYPLATIKLLYRPLAALAMILLVITMCAVTIHAIPKYSKLCQDRRDILAAITKLLYRSEAYWSYLYWP